MCQIPNTAFKNQIQPQLHYKHLPHFSFTLSYVGMLHKYHYRYIQHFHTKYDTNCITSISMPLFHVTYKLHMLQLNLMIYMKLHSQSWECNLCIISDNVQQIDYQITSGGTNCIKGRLLVYSLTIPMILPYITSTRETKHGSSGLEAYFLTMSYLKQNADWCNI